VVHFPPIIVRSPEGEIVILCLREISLVESGLSGLAASGRNPANMQRISSRLGGLTRYFSAVCNIKLISSSRATGSKLIVSRGVSVVPTTTSLYHGIAKRTRPSVVLGIIIAESLLRKDLSRTICTPWLGLIVGFESGLSILTTSSENTPVALITRFDLSSNSLPVIISFARTPLIFPFFTLSEWTCRS